VTNKIFYGDDGGAATAHIGSSVGGQEKYAIVTVDKNTAKKIGAISTSVHSTTSYEADPGVFERNAHMAMLDAAPELLDAIRFVKENSVVLLEVKGMPVDNKYPLTPLAGTVVEHDVSAHIFNLIGGLLGCWGLAGFAYSSENDGKLLRAVAPVKKSAEEQSSHGYTDDLGWHQDNADRLFPEVLKCPSNSLGPMNSHQAFVAIRPDPSTPMEVVALADVIDEITRNYGSGIIDQLELAEYAVDQPASHDHRHDHRYESKPLLMRKSDGSFHGRIDIGAVKGLSVKARNAFELFRQVSENTKCSTKICLSPGALLLYSNTLMMHRRRRYSPRFNGKDRFYIRLYLLEANVLDPLAMMADGRVLP
jgi:L-asparagine oxygenase